MIGRKILNIIFIASISAIAKSDTDIELGYVLPYVSEVANKDSYYGAYFKGGYRTEGGFGLTAEYNDLSIDFDSYNWFLGGDYKYKILHSDIRASAMVNLDRYKFQLDACTPLYRQWGLHSGGSHSQKYKRHGRLTDVFIGGYYQFNKYSIGVDYQVGNAQGNRGENIQDRVNLSLGFSDWK